MLVAPIGLRRQPEYVPARIAAAALHRPRGCGRPGSAAAERAEFSESLNRTHSSAGDNGKATKLSTRPSVVSPASRIDWNAPLAAGEHQSVTYKYVVYVRD